VTNEEFDAIFRSYFEKFGEFPTMVPLDLGHANLTMEEDAAYMQAAIDSGKPIDWYAIFPPLPEGCLS